MDRERNEGQLQPMKPSKTVSERLKMIHSKLKLKISRPLRHIEWTRPFHLQLVLNYILHLQAHHSIQNCQVHLLPSQQYRSRRPYIAFLVPKMTCNLFKIPNTLDHQEKL